MLMFKFIHCLVNYGVLLLGVSSLTAWSTTGVLMSPGYGGYQNRNAAALLHNNNIGNNRLLPPRLQSITQKLMTTQKTRSITLPRATSPKSRSTTPRLPSTTPLRQRNSGILHDYVCCAAPA